MGKSKSKRADRPRRSSIWDAVMSATTAGWAATARLCVVLIVICSAAAIAVTLLDARAVTAAMAWLTSL